MIYRYHSRIVDFDIEGSALSNTLANERRACVIRTIQYVTPAKYRLAILSLLCVLSGLTADAVNTVTTRWCVPATGSTAST